MRLKVFCGIVAALGIAGIASFVMMKETQKPTKIVPIHFKETIGSLAYEIELKKNQFGFDDEIVVYAKVTNAGKGTFTYRSGSSGCPKHVFIQIVHQKKHTLLAMKPNDQFCSADDTLTHLAPVESVEDEWILTPKQWIKSELKPADEGIYDLEVYLPPEQISTFGSDEAWRLATKIPITVNE